VLAGFKKGLVVLNQFFYELFSCKHVVSLDIYLIKKQETAKFFTVSCKIIYLFRKIYMNTKIFNLLQKNLKDSFSLPKYSNIAIDADTMVQDLPWTPARYSKFKDAVEAELQLPCDYIGTLRSITDDLSERYILRFFSEIWKPRTGDYEHTGWELADEVNKLNPKSVLDVGCGYHPFKGRINNLIGIDPYNNCADYEVDILDYKVKPASHDVILALGSINFNSRDEIEARFSHCVNLLAPGGKFYLRANPGITHKTGPYVEIFPWSFEVVNEFAEKYNLHLDTFKRDANNRLYFVYTKIS
jgi:SAM-dependent methyltransferase